MITFVVPSVPVAQPRQRHRIVAAAGRSFVSNYTPSKSPVNAFKASVQHAAAAVYSGAPLDGALILNVTFIMPRPKSKTRKRGDNPGYPHTGRPDIDNLLKSLKDALSGLAWRDDAQVCQLIAGKRVAAGDEQPHVRVSIQELEHPWSDLTDELLNEYGPYADFEAWCRWAGEAVPDDSGEAIKLWKTARDQ